jgi:hypothetical protein
MEAELSFKKVGIANRRDGDGGKKVTSRRILAIAFNGEEKLIPADTIAKAKFTIDMARIFGVPVSGNRLDFTGEENLWYSFQEVALNSSIRTAQNVADCIAFEVK